MNWVAIGALGEILGALAVLVTLLYLAAQIRHNTRAMSVATYESVLSGYNRLTIATASDPTLARISNQGLEAPDSLSEEEAIQFSFLMRSLCNQWLKLLRLREHGALSESDWRAFALEAAQILGTPGGSAFRAQNHLFADVYTEIDALPKDAVSRFRLERETSAPGSTDDA